MIAERAKEQLEAFRFDDGFAGCVVDDHMREIGLPGNGAERREFGCGEAHHIELLCARVGHVVELGFFG